jgi:glycosyltransferase involved in cell wall biosynthesis
VWSDAGHEVTVLTVDRALRPKEASELHINTAGELSGFRTIALPLPGIFRFLRRAFKSGEGHSAAAGGANVSLKSKIIGWLKSRGLMSSVRWPDMHGAWVQSALRSIGDEKFDAVVSTFGPPAVISVGWALKSRGQAKKWIIDYRDLWTANPSFRGFPIFRWFELVAENYYLRRADGITTVSQPLANTLMNRVRDVRVFPNGFEGENAHVAIGAKKKDRKVIRYTGSLYWPHQDPTPLFKVLKARLDRGLTDVCVEFYGPALEKILILANQFGVLSIVKVFNPVAREESLILQREADALLFLESPSTPGREGILTGKLFEYLATRKPILAIGVRPESLVGEIIVECDAGACVDKKERQVETFIEQIVANSVALVPRGLPPRFSRRTIAMEMLRFVETV